MLKIQKRGYDITIFAVLVILTLAVIIPFFWVITSAFKSDLEIFGGSLFVPQHWRWENFAVAWTAGNFGTYFWNSLFVAVMVTILQVLVACPAGYSFAKLRFRKYPILFYLFLFGMTLPAQSILIPLFYQLKSYGLLDQLWGLILSLVGISTPFSVYLMRNFFRDLPDSLGEAARVDGAGEWRIFTKIMLPLSKPGVLALAVFSFLDAWNEFLLSLLLLISDGKRTIPLGLLRFQDVHTSNYGVVFASVVLAFIPSILVYVLLQRSFVRGISAGASKE